MYGDGRSSSKCSATSSSSTDGANGRNPSRNFTFRLSRFCISGLRASPRMLRLPSARGPNSMRPWNHPPTWPAARRAATSAASASRSPARVARARERANRPLGVEVRELRPEVAARHRVARAAVRRPMPAAGRDGCATRRRRRPPRRPRRPPPAESRGRRRRRSRGALPLATQLSATPPAMHEVAAAGGRRAPCAPAAARCPR